MQKGDQLVSSAPRDVLTPREVAERSGFSYHAILRAIRRGDLVASEPVPGHYRIGLDEYDRWLHTPVRNPNSHPPATDGHERQGRARTGRPDRGSFAALRAIEGGS